MRLISQNEEAAQWRFSATGSKPCVGSNLRHEAAPHTSRNNLMAQHPHELIGHFERLVRRDPASRGLIGVDGSGPGIGELLPAAAMFREARGVVGIVTGFFIPHREAARDASSISTDLSSVDCSQFGSAETDGPPGAAVLAAVLSELGFTPRIITDEPCRPVVVEAANVVGLPAGTVVSVPIERSGGRQRLEQIAFEEWSARLTHLVAVERVGPSHHRESIGWNDPDAVQTGNFDEQVPESAFDRCFNMRGEAIDHFTAALHELFPDRLQSARKPDNAGDGGVSTQGESLSDSMGHIATVGVGDGGNEIGMGRFAWSALRERIRGDAAARIPCRIATDRTIVAGTSNLGAYALAASIAFLHQRVDVLREHSCDAQAAMLVRLVENAGAVDGVTRTPEPTVDGVPFLTGIEPWAAIRRELGFRD